MSIYPWFKALHVLAACALIGPMMLIQRWQYLVRHEVGRRALNELHRLTGLGGWVLFLSGVILLFLQQGGMLHQPWMWISIVLFVAIQLFDHFWADRRETTLEQDAAPVPDLSPGLPSDRALGIWLVVKLALYSLIFLFMMLKPGI